MLKLQHLTKQFGAAPLFTDLCMEVDAPVVLWAPSGWGKTTLLRILMGLERPTTGSVEGVGRVAAVFQEDRLCPQLNAVQNVTLVLPGAENQYKEQITSDFQQLGMGTAALQLPARRLSGGQKRRVALLRALWAPSGWGKTTLLRILMGLERPTTGSVEGVGRVAAVFQEDRLCPQLNAVQNVTLVLPGVENQYKEQIISDFQQLGMDIAALQLPARRLSGGQKRRVALLRALWAPSDTLLLDEPFTGMDPDTLQRAAALLRQRCAGKPVLLATHDESAIRALGWPVVELEKLGTRAKA